MKLKCLLAMLLLTFLSCSNTPAVEDKIDSLPHSEPGTTESRAGGQVPA